MSGLGLGHESPSIYHENKLKSYEIKDSVGTNGAFRESGASQHLKDALPKICSLPRSASVDEVVEALKITGGVIIRDAVSHEDIDKIESNSRTCAEKVVMHPLYQATCDKSLTTRNWFWSGRKKTHATSAPQIQNTVCFSINPGTHKQPLHRDDWAYHVVASKMDEYPDDLQRDTGLGWFVAAKDATVENEASRFIPGSHLWEHEREPDNDLVEYATLRKETHS